MTLKANRPKNRRAAEISAARLRLGYVSVWSGEALFAPLRFKKVRRKLLAILYRLCYTVPVGCGRGGFLLPCGFLRGRGGFLLPCGFPCGRGGFLLPCGFPRGRGAERAVFC